jgi:Holliday junction resolvase RusA-like endonuclease
MTEELIEALDSSNKGDIPSPFGEEQYVLLGSPASVQSRKSVRDAYLKSIRDQLKDLKYLLTGEIMLEIVWLVSAKHRYETDAKSDIDNCIKPIIDAFTGPEGLFVDDCQLRGLYICWRHIESGQERLVFDFKFQGDQYSVKKELAFVQLEGGLCSPVNLDWPKEYRTIWAKALNEGRLAKDNLEALGAPYLSVSGYLAGNQPFHRSRVTEFPILSLDEFSSQCVKNV